MKISALLVGLALWLTLPITAKAEDTEDLLNVYGLTLGGPIKSDLELEMDALEADLLSIQATNQINEEYNKVLQQFIERREKEIDNILNDISVYQSKNQKLSNDISNKIFTSDISELIKLDSEYKSNSHNISELLEGMNDYKIDYDYRSINSETSDIEAQLEKTKRLYIDSLDTYDLGDVSNIKWILPNDKYVTSGYGYRIDPINPSTVRFHAGTDYRGSIGTGIGALFNGKVISTGWSTTIGNYVTVQCGDNVKYLICHCSEVYVSQGQIVHQYDTIAAVGATGTRCTGPHLHLALYLNGVTYDVDELFK